MYSNVSSYILIWDNWLLSCQWLFMRRVWLLFFITSHQVFIPMSEILPDPSAGWTVSHPFFILKILHSFHNLSGHWLDLLQSIHALGSPDLGQALQCWVDWKNCFHWPAEKSPPNVAQDAVGLCPKGTLFAHNCWLTVLYHLMVHLVPSSRSFSKMFNSIWLSIYPWGIPLMTDL